MGVTAWITGILIAGVVVSLAMVLVFLWRVYVRGGPDHLVRAAKALREVYDPEWPSKLLRYLPGARKGEEEEEEEDQEPEEVIEQQSA